MWRRNVFQLHGVDARGRAVLSRRVKRGQLLQVVASLQPCVIGMEAGDLVEERRENEKEECAPVRKQGGVMLFRRQLSWVPGWTGGLSLLLRTDQVAVTRYTGVL